MPDFAPHNIHLTVEDTAASHHKLLKEVLAAHETLMEATEKLERQEKDYSHTDIETDYSNYNTLSADTEIFTQDEPDAELAAAIAEAENTIKQFALSDHHPADIADALEILSAGDRFAFWELFKAEIPPELFAYLNSTVRLPLLEDMTDDELSALILSLDNDDALDILIDLDEDLQQRVLNLLPDVDRNRMLEGLSLPEDSAGRLMQRDVVAVPEYWTVGRLIEHLRTTPQNLPDSFHEIYLTDPKFVVIGSLEPSLILRSKQEIRLSEIMDTDIETIPLDMDQEDVALLFQKYGLMAAPVVRSNGRLAGIITIDDIVDVITEEAEEDILNLAGVSDSDVYEALLTTTRKRVSWLGVNLITALLASFVIGIFGETLEKTIALAILMPIVASMGGNAGTQTLTVTVRALAAREITPSNTGRLIFKEAMVGVINGSFFAVVMGIVTYFWFGNLVVALVIACAIVINLISAGLAGAMIPIGLSRAGIDPAVSSSVFLTTVTDVVGFIGFLGLASLFL